ncbi:transcriptional regulator [Clostridium butyricum]|uniref:transcriptional regulator n=1 Tax=Clostridium butyricum TaxID=1492 RepID=UPI00374F01F3
MEENLFKKTESQLYRYYEYKSKIQKFRRKVDDLEDQIISLDNQMRNVHKYISLDTMPPSAGCGERVQSSISGTSYMEKQMEQEVTKLEKRKIEKIKTKIKTEAKIMEMNSFIRIMDSNIENLSEEDKRFIEYFYGAKKKIPFIAMQLNLSVPTCYRHREELVKNIADFMWMYK